MQTDLPTPPEISSYTDVDRFQDAVREWSIQYELAYACLYPANGLRKPPKPEETRPERPDGPSIPIPVPDTDIEWLPCERIDDKSVEHVAKYRAEGRIIRGERLGTAIVGVKCVDLRASKDTHYTEWGQDAHDIAELMALVTDPVTRGPTDPWQRISQYRRDLLELTQTKAKQAAIHADHQERLKKWAETNSDWYFKTYLPWEIARTKYQVAFDTLRDWEAAHNLAARKRADLRQQIVYGLIRTVIAAAVAGGIFLLGSHWF